MDLQEAGMKVPELENRPNLEGEQAELLYIYLIISSSRPASFSDVPMRLPLTEIQAGYDMLEVQELYTKREFVRWMRALDDAFVNYHIEHREKIKEREREREKRKRRP